MRTVPWPTAEADIDPIDDRCLPGRFQRRLAFAPLPIGLQLHFPSFEPDPDEGLPTDDLGEPGAAPLDRNATA